MIKVNNVTKEFISSKKYPGMKGAIKGLVSREKVKKTAVKDISFRIKKGEIVGYIGSNGAGKSTTIKMMSGIIVPTCGDIEVDGIVPYKERVLNAKNIGVVFGQRTQLWWDLPLSETFSILKEIYCVDDKSFNMRIKFLNQILGINEFMNSTVRTLSLGQRMRADLAAALIHNPKILFLDEPTIGLDLVAKENIRKAIREINAKYNTTIILTTHDLVDIEELCNRIMIIDKGSLIFDGSLEGIKEKYGVTRKIEIDLKDKSQLKRINFNKEFKHNSQDFKHQICGKTVNFTFNKNKIAVSEIISKVMSKSIVNDIKIYDTDINDIVKNIYLNGV